MDLYIIKLGGSVITAKDENRIEAKLGELKRIANEIKRAMEERKFRLIVLHGAGPFGHKLVSDYGCNNGIKTERQVEGFVRTHNSMEDLDKVVSDVFREAGLLGFPIQPSACVVQKNKKIVKFDVGIIRKIMELGEGIIPIMYGDMVVDEKLGASVVSGDALIVQLARKLKAKRVFAGTDVDGVFTADPKSVEGAELIQKITKKNFDEIVKIAEGAKGVDVTEGMKGKIMKLKSLKGLDVFIFNLSKQDNLYSLLKGEKVIGTEIRL